MKITIHGTGYVGLVTGACFASIGHEVLCVDIDPAKVAKLKQGQVPIYEPGLKELVKKALAESTLKFTENTETGVEFSRIQFICVNTPTVIDSGADISNILLVAESIAKCMTTPKLVINKSTAPPGTVHKIKQKIDDTLQQLNKNISFSVASNPEFLKEGAAVVDFLEPSRIVVGTDDSENQSLFTALYRHFNNKIVFMDILSAELSKYAANAMLAAKISFMNEIAGIAEKSGADIEAVKHAISLDPRIGPYFISPGCGYGGSCFPKDVQALAHFAATLGIEPLLLNAVEHVNNQQKKLLAKKILDYFHFNIQHQIIALWGLAFKPDTDDMRSASSISLMEILWQNGAIVQAYDPIASDEAKKLFPNEIAHGKLVLCSSAAAALDNVCALAIVTEWQEFKDYSYSTLGNLLTNIPVFDGRNLYDAAKMHHIGIDYFSIGRAKIS